MILVSFVLAAIAGLCNAYSIQQDDGYILECIYRDSTITASFKIDKMEISKDDTLDLALSIYNNSEEDIFVFPNFQKSYVVDQILERPKGIIIDYGGMFEDVSLEHEMKMKIIKPKEFYFQSKKVLGKDLEYDNFPKIVEITLSLGYIQNKAKIELYKNLGAYPIEPKYLEELVILHNFTIDAALTREDIGSLKFTFKDANK